jgi:tetratricopeptide (TPR) repeat protein
MDLHAQQKRNIGLAVAVVAVIAVAGVVGASVWKARQQAAKRAEAVAIRAKANEDARHGQLYHAISGFEQLIKLNPKDADAWQRVGLLYRATGQLGRSWDALNQAAQLDPNDKLSRVALAMLGPHLGRMNESDHLLREVLDKDPTYPDALIAHASLTIRLDPTQAGLASAEREVNQAISEHPTGPAYDVRGQVHRAQRRFKEAIADFQKAISIEPRAKSHYIFLSQSYAAVGDTQHARATMAQYLKMPRAPQPADAPANARAGTTQ